MSTSINAYINSQESPLSAHTSTEIDEICIYIDKGLLVNRKKGAVDLSGHTGNTPNMIQEMRPASYHPLAL